MKYPGTKGPVSLIILLLVVMNIPFIVDVEGTSRFSGGDGSPGSPFMITNLTELQEMRHHLDSHFILQNDINASKTSTWNGGKGFDPISEDLSGYYTGFDGPMFNGTLNGNGFSITGIYIGRSGHLDHRGFFGCIGPSGLVRDLTLLDMNVSGDTNVGGLACINMGTIINCHVEGRVQGPIVGGFVYRNDGDISGCSSSVEVQGTHHPVGGFVGLNDGEILDCHSRSDVHGSRFGTAGFASTGSGTMIDCSFMGNVSGEGIENPLTNIRSSAIINSYYNINGTTLNGYVPHSPYGIFGDQFDSWMDGGMELDIDDYLEKENGSYTIEGFQGLYDMIPFVYADHEFDLMADIDLSGWEGFNIPFMGSDFDGKGHTISGLSIFSPHENNIGFFSEIFTDATVRNLDINGFNISGDSYVGGMTGWCQGSIIDCDVNGHSAGNDYIGGLSGHVLNADIVGCSSGGYATGERYIGGLAGRSFNSTIRDCSSSSQVSGGGNQIGGLVGEESPELYGSVPDGIRGIFNCESSGSISGNEKVGGLVGWSFGLIEGSHSTGAVDGYRYVGGLVGFNYYGEISSCFSTGSARATGTHAGGLVGSNSADIRFSFATGEVDANQHAGGLSGTSEDCDIEQTASHGEVDGWTAVGGLIGSAVNCHINDSYSYSEVSGNDKVGGLVGTDSRSSTMNCYSCGPVQGSENVGGMIGYCYHDDHEVSDSFFDTETSHQHTSTGGEGKNLLQMRSESTFSDAGWNLRDIWQIDDRDTRPFLRNLDYSNMIVGDLDPVAYPTYEYFTDLDPDLPFDGLPDDLEWEIDSNAGPWLSVNDDGEVHGIPPVDSDGEYSVTVSLVFDSMVFSTIEGELTVVNMEETLRITNSFNNTCLENSIYSVQCEFMDLGPKSRPLQWHLKTNARFLSLDQFSAIIEGIPGNDDLGTFWVNVSVRDTYGRFAFHNYTLEIFNVNSHPIIEDSQLPPATARYHYSHNMSGVDLDPTSDVLSWSMRSNSTLFTIDPNTGTIEGDPTDSEEGSVWINITLSDGIGGLTSVNFSLMIHEYPFKPGLKDNDTAYSSDEDVPIVIDPDAHFLHMDRHDPVFVLEAEHFTISMDGVNLTIHPQADWSGSEEIKLIGLFEDVELELILAIEITPVNDPPRNLEIITEIGNKVVLDCTFVDPESMTGFTYKWVSDRAGVLGVDRTLLLNLDEGIHNITLTVTDPQGGSSSTSIDLEIPPKEEESEGGKGLILPLIIILSVVGILVLLIVVIIVARGKRKDEEEEVTPEEVDEVPTGDNLQSFIPESSESDLSEEDLTPFQEQPVLGDENEEIPDDQDILVEIEVGAESIPQ